MPTDGDRLIEDLIRRNWLILAGMLLISLLWRSYPVTLGVLGGGLVVIAGFHSLRRSLVRLLQTSGRQSRSVFQIRAFIRLLGLAGAIYVLLGPLKVHPLALVAGLSVVVINLMWTTVMRSLA